MRLGSRLTEWTVDHYRVVTAVTAAVTILVALAAAVPSVLPGGLGGLHAVEIDTDPENMLSADEPVRVFHNHMKKTLSLHDIVVVGVVNESRPDGVFHPDSLRRVHALTEFAKRLTGTLDGMSLAYAPADDAMGMDTEDRVFLDAVRSRDASSIHSTYEDAVRTLALALAIDRSNETGSPERVHPHRGAGPRGLHGHDYL